MINAPSSKAIRLQYVPNDHRLQFMQTVDAKAYTISTEEKSINLKYSKVTLATTADSTDASCECSRQWCECIELMGEQCTKRSTLRERRHAPEAGIPLKSRESSTRSSTRILEEYFVFAWLCVCVCWLEHLASSSSVFAWRFTQSDPLANYQNTSSSFFALPNASPSRASCPCPLPLTTSTLILPSNTPPNYYFYTESGAFLCDP